MKTNPAKIIFTTLGSFLYSLIGILYIPMLLLATCNVIDYITGLMATSKRKDKISSYKSIEGIAKKITLWLLVIVGVVIDIMLAYTSETLGFVLPFKYVVSCIVAVWIVCNELISILENVIDIGVNIPAFLLPLVKHIKTQTESLTGSTETMEENQRDEYLKGGD